MDVSATAQTDSFKFEEETRSPDIALVSGDVYVIVYDDKDGNQGALLTISIDSAGKISSIIDSCAFDTGGDIFEPKIIQVDSDTYAIVYQGGSDADAISIKTVTISTAGAITGTTTCTSTNFAVDSDAEDGNAGPEIVDAGSDTFAVIYENENDDIFKFTEDISSTGSFSSPSGSPTSNNIDGSFRSIDITNIDSDSFAFVYADTSNSTGIVYTFDVAADGTLSSSDTATFQTGSISDPTISAIDSDTFVIVYAQSGAGLILKTVDISSTGAITGSSAATIKGSKTIDTGDDFIPAKVTAVDSDTFAIVYGQTNNLAFKTLDITAEGVPSSTFNQELDISVSDFVTDPKIIKISDTVFAVVHGGNSAGDGYLRTITIPAETTTTPKSSDGDTTAPTIGKSSTGRQVVENGFSYESNLGGFTQLDADLGLTHMDSLKVAVGGLPLDAPLDPDAPIPPDASPTSPGEISDDVREKLNERGLGDVAKTFDNISDTINALDNFFNGPPPNSPPDHASPAPQEISDVLDNLKQGLDQSRVNPESHANPEQAAQINNLLDRIAQKIAEIEAEI